MSEMKSSPFASATINKVEKNDDQPPAKEKKDHRRRFEEINFPDGSVEEFQNKSKHHSLKRMQLYIRILQEREGSKDSLTADEKKLYSKLRRSYTLLEELDLKGEKSIVLKRKVDKEKKNSQALRVIPNEEIFDCIKKVHIRLGHSRNVGKHVEILSKEVYSVTLRDVRNYIKTCCICLESPLCHSKKTGIEKINDVSSFGNRFEVHLLDFTDNIGVGWRGEEYRWAMLLEDYSTKVLYVRPLYSNNSQETSQELSIVLGFIGYPAFLCGDLEGVVQSNKMIQSMKGPTDDCSTASDSSTVTEEEYSTCKATKEILLGMVDEYKKKHPQSNHTWVQFIGLYMACRNSSKSCGENNTAPYSRIFIRDYPFPTCASSVNIDVAENTEKVAAVVKVYEKDTQTTISMGKIHNRNGSDDALYNSESTTKDVMERYRGLLQVGTVEQMIPIEKKEIKIEFEGREEWNRSPQLRKGYCEILPSVAWKYCTTDGTKEYKFLVVYWDCIFCRLSGTNTIPYIKYYEESYYQMMKSTNRWWCISTLVAFVCLKMHKHHCGDILFDICPYPSSDPHIIHRLPRQIAKVIVIICDGSHFAFMEINIPNRYVVIRDGKLEQKTMEKWRLHVNFMLKKWGLIEDPSTQVVFAPEIVPYFTREAPRTKIGIFEIICLQTVKQEDDTECGPIAAYHAWNVINSESKPDATQSLRSAVITEILSMWNEYEKCFRVRLPILKVIDKTQILRQNIDGTVYGTMAIEECWICDSQIGIQDIFEANPCHHRYHVNCIHELQRECLAKGDALVTCLQCNTRISNLSAFERMSTPSELLETPINSVVGTEFEKIASSQLTTATIMVQKQSKLLTTGTIIPSEEASKIIISRDVGGKREKIDKVVVHASSRKVPVLAEAKVTPVQSEIWKTGSVEPPTKKRKTKEEAKIIEKQTEIIPNAGMKEGRIQTEVMPTTTVKEEKKTIVSPAQLAILNSDSVIPVQEKTKTGKETKTP